jgi:hypothetical protein
MKRLILSTAAVVALTAPLAQAANAHDTRSSPTSNLPAFSLVDSRPASVSTCARQLDTDDMSISSQNFEPKYDALDARGADDFTVTHRCTVSQVHVRGNYHSGAGPAASVNVTFFVARPNGGVGAVYRRRHEQPYADPSGVGKFYVLLSAPVTFRPGTYWVSVQANMDEDTAGEWSWQTTNKLIGHPAMWQNPGDGFQTGCVKFTNAVKCFSVLALSFSFALLK